MRRENLEAPVIAALDALGGHARIAEVCQFVWDNYEPRLRASGKYFYVWQYELRWASDALVKAGQIQKGPPRGIWHLKR